MNYICHRRLWIAARNEGKLKSHESCTDVRAWSHDIQTRNCYLRDWIKCDMAICVVPVSTLSSILSIMTCRSRGKVTSRCHSGCQSKVLLHRLCSSCTAMKDSLSNNKEFEKYFRDENCETINWPCDKCLEILKSIKMFWKIVIEKVLRVTVPRPQEFKYTDICSLRNIVKEWEKELVEEATFVKSCSLLSERTDNIKKEKDSVKRLADNVENKCFYNVCQSKETETECEFRNIAIQTDGRSMRQKISKCISARIKMVNLECESNGHKDDEVIMIYKNNMQNLQQQFDLQKNEVDRLKKENLTLNVELQRYRQKCSKICFHGDSLSIGDNTVALISSPVDSKEKMEAKDIDSEMIITLKNCKDENFRHVSVIQVMHKTNELNLSETNSSYYKKEDPIHILNKVHETFESIVKREISIASKTNKSFNNKNVVIKTTFNDVSESKSTPSCSISSYSVMSECHFESANDTYGTSIASGK